LSLPSPALAQQYSETNPPGNKEAEEIQFSLKARAELGNEPRFGGDLAALKTNNAVLLPLRNTQISGRLPSLELRASKALTPDVWAHLSGELNQVMGDPITNPDLESAWQQRQTWRLGGGLGDKPLYVAQVRDVYLDMADAARNGHLRMGQFKIPFGNEDLSARTLPQVLAPEETPMSDALGGLGAINFQASALSRRYDIGALLSGKVGKDSYQLGLVNGTGPNRLDDNGDKDKTRTITAVAELIGIPSRTRSWVPRS
jgi:hypothetical protein